MRRLAPVALLLLVFCAGLVAGAWLSIGKRAAAFAAGVEQRLAETAHTTPARTSSTGREFASDEDMLTAIMSAVSEEEPLLRAHRLHDLLGSLSSAELAVLFARTLRAEDRERRGVLLAALLTRWAALDPTAATEAVRPYRERFRANGGVDWWTSSLESAVYRAWAHAFPDAALAEAMATPNAPWAWNTAWTAMESLAEGDPTRQLEALAPMRPNRLRDGMCEKAIKALAEKDSTAAEAHLKWIADPRRRARLQAEILGKLSERDAAAGLARLAEVAPDLQPGTASTQLITGVLRAAAAQDAAAALAAVDGLPEELRPQAIGAALVGWAGKHPVDALTWAADHGVNPSEARAAMFFGDNGIMGWNSLGSAAFESDWAQTFAWLRARPASPERDAMLGQGIWRASPEEALQIYAELSNRGKATFAEHVVQAAFRNGEASALQWVKAQSPGAVRKRGIWTLAIMQAGHAPEQIDTLADAWPAGPDRDAALRGLALSVSRNDHRRALDFARRVSGAPARETAFENIARSWLFSDPSAARAWVTSAPELSSEQKRVLLRGFDD